ncbi:MAG: MutS-related protein, partial [Bryobacteraceae bacterium]
MTAPGDPHSEYARRLQDRQAECRRHERLHVRIGNLRLVVALLFAWTAFAAFAQHSVAPWWPLAPLAGFVALGIAHEIVLRRRQRAERAIRFFEQGVARLEDRWIGAGQSGDRFRDANHPYSEDLDLFGRGSLFELLSSARTRAGEETLARWLLSAASLQEIRDRQKAIDELRGKLDLREDLAVLGEEIGAGVHPAALIAWAEQPRRLPGGWVRAAAALISAIVLATAVLLPFKALLAALALSAGFGLWLRNRVLTVAREAESASHDLALLASVLQRLEREPFASPRLTELRKALDSAGDPPSRRIARLNRLMELADSRDNLFMRLIGPPLLYATHLAFALEAWRVESGAAVR